MNAILFLAGLLCGGCFSVVFLCGMQLHRLNKYEAEIHRLREKLNKK